jgi:hypothetical protein
MCQRGFDSSLFVIEARNSLQIGVIWSKLVVRNGLTSCNASDKTTFAYQEDFDCKTVSYDGNIFKHINGFL